MNEAWERSVFSENQAASLVCEGNRKKKNRKEGAAAINIWFVDSTRLIDRNTKICPSSHLKQQIDG